MWGQGQQGHLLISGRLYSSACHLLQKHESWPHLSRSGRASESPIDAPVHADMCLVRWPKRDCELSKCSFPTFGAPKWKNPQRLLQWSLGLLAPGFLSRLVGDKRCWRMLMEVSWVEAMGRETVLQKHGIVYFQMGALGGGWEDWGAYSPFSSPSFLPCPSLLKSQQKSQRCKRGSMFCLRKHYLALDSR